MYVVRPDITDQDVGTVRADVQNHVTSLGGTVEKENIMGKRQLAFEIKDFTEGIYTLLHVKLPAESPGKLKEQLKIDERVIRYMVTVVDRKRTDKPASGSSDTRAGNNAG